MVILTVTLLPLATPDEVEMTTLTGVDSCTNWPATAQTVSIPSFSVMLDAFPMNWMLGTSDISVIKVPKWLMSHIISYHAASVSALAKAYYNVTVYI